MRRNLLFFLALLFIFSCSRSDIRTQDDKVLYEGNRGNTRYRILIPEKISTGRLFCVKLRIEGDGINYIEKVAWGESQTSAWTGPEKQKDYSEFQTTLCLNQPGEYQLPEIEIHSDEVFILQSLSGELDIELQSSLIEGQEELFSYLEERDIPDHRWMLWLAIPLVIAFILILLIYWRHRKKMFYLPPRTAEERLGEQLEYLYRKKERLNNRQFSMEMGKILRDYLDLEYEAVYHSLTSREIRDKWNENNIFPEWFSTPLTAILEREELALFAPEGEDELDSEGDYRFLRDFLEYRLKLKKQEDKDV